jgi:ATP-binding cassette subfamily F protein 3
MEQLAKLEGTEGGEGLPLAPAGKPSSATPSNGGNTPRNAPQAGVQLSWEEQKKLDAARRKIEKEVANLENKIAELEEKKSALENKMADPAVYSNGEKAKAVQREIEAIAAEIEEVTLKWEEATERL